MQINKENAKILGIDYGRAKVGLAIAEGGLAEPLSVIGYKDIELFSQEIKKILETEKIEKIVVGISEGKMAEETNRFVSALNLKLSVPVDTFDETLTSLDAQTLSREAGVSRKKRKNMEDAYAASIMLQNYLDSR